MDITPKTKKAMSKDEVALLVNLIQSNPMITTKETNAATNYLKKECWVSITNTFNSKSGRIPRRREQLELKWDNLKKAARKRAAYIRMNNLKNGGGKPNVISMDDILDRVIGVLGYTKSKDKKLKGNQDDGWLQRNLAIAKYYNKKSEILDLEIKKLKMELANKENNCNINNYL